ncbi:hypothetical protein J2S00_001308 [Caldalkalibacillus uzonensis]|uniref:DUF1659 domain-containing protein n=1 Tax=Caldalkalibacillus uzonensis TaxID=353224 RepID=A0ABU0CU26_9BACI|nr:DUF1659 domain-containing protein [Caldalkalibacillus uzonensis]MDQ0338522.1 hypothetical protein [Caldalkalibacillus uzonensis]
MAVMSNPFDTRLTLIFYVGDDEEGNPIERSKTFSRVKPTAADVDLYEVAQALASLQTYTLVETERSDRATLINIE